VGADSRQELDDISILVHSYMPPLLFVKTSLEPILCLSSQANFPSDDVPNVVMRRVQSGTNTSHWPVANLDECRRAVPSGCVHKVVTYYVFFLCREILGARHVT
jgi:hypothetical protein